MQLIIGFFVAIIIAYTAYRFHSLSRSGAYAAALVGAVIFGIGGWQWAVLLLTFFISSSVLTQSFKKQKHSVNEKYYKGGRRDAGQVFGNGVVAALFTAFHALLPASDWPWVGFSAAVAAVNADTWATELGILDPNLPRLITRLDIHVEKGTSGGISLIGTLAALMGAASIGVLAALLDPSGTKWELLLIITLAGLVGSLFDSLLGATVQAMYFCPADQKETEKHPLHTCGSQTLRIRGWNWLNNDAVNLACSALGGLIAFAFVNF